MQKQFFQAISTKYIGPTNTKGGRIVAKASAGKITVNWDYSLGHDANHVAAAQALVNKLGWVGGNYGEIVGGVLDNETYAFVMMGV